MGEGGVRRTLEAPPVFPIRFSRTLHSGDAHTRESATVALHHRVEAHYKSFVPQCGQAQLQTLLRQPAARPEPPQRGAGEMARERIEHDGLVTAQPRRATPSSWVTEESSCSTRAFRSDDSPRDRAPCMGAPFRRPLRRQRPLETHLRPSERRVFGAPCLPSEPARQTCSRRNILSWATPP